MLNQPTCYLAPSCTAWKMGRLQQGIIAIKPILKDELIAVWGGEVVTRETLDTLSPRLRQLSVQVEEGLYLVTLHEGPGDYVNHSCNPNGGLNGQIAVVAMREIAPGEQVTIDYAMCDGSDYDEFECECGAPNCRHRVSGRDWRSPELWARYRGYFSPYLARRIARLQSGESIEYS